MNLQCPRYPSGRRTHIQHLFAKFGRGRDATGMGLGLYVSRQIVQEHGGELVAVSEPGKGTTFSYDLVEAS